MDEVRARDEFGQEIRPGDRVARWETATSVRYGKVLSVETVDAGQGPVWMADVAWDRGGSGWYGAHLLQLTAPSYLLTARTVLGTVRLDLKAQAADELYGVLTDSWWLRHLVHVQVTDRRGDDVTAVFALAY